ncbi:endonuclease domain-containing protein [Fulvivirgaceae bacterium BMA10]|uniref:Endonuclease domain-containing protein n=1 Tax=Splendidivirga corallicola TaxID=3051826 RepID=A0ABT8L1T6_9BACT|nr:endonuclease domain-containing protein [Fulvivirgaceae bacterium BMA10]
MERNKSPRVSSNRLYQFARENRKNPTEAENALWQRLRNRQLKGSKFRRQHPMDDFIADFYCMEYKLIIEVDGGYHLSKSQREYDQSRSLKLENLGIKTIRFTNEQVLQEIDMVLDEIAKHLIPDPSPQ